MQSCFELEIKFDTKRRNAAFSSLRCQELAHNLVTPAGQDDRLTLSARSLISAKMTSLLNSPSAIACFVGGRLQTMSTIASRISLAIDNYRDCMQQTNIFEPRLNISYLFFSSDAKKKSRRRRSPTF